jgi:hypothetical protein
MGPCSRTPSGPAVKVDCINRPDRRLLPANANTSNFSCNAGAIHRGRLIEERLWPIRAESAPTGRARGGPEYVPKRPLHQKRKMGFSGRSGPQTGALDQHLAGQMKPPTFPRRWKSEGPPLSADLQSSCSPAFRRPSRTGSSCARYVGLSLSAVQLVRARDTVKAGLIAIPTSTEEYAS